jgi:FixJ family two-component response regulator
VTASKATIYVVDDDEAVRSALRLLFRSVGLTAVAYSSAQAFLEDYSHDQPGCLVLDVRMPGMSGLELQHQLNARGAIVPVIFITGHGDVPMAVEAMQHGAFDLVQKPFRDQELLDRVHRALEKDQESRGQLRQTDGIRRRFATLTPREQEVLALMVQGKANKVMAGDLGLSQRTVEIHRAHIMDKMEARSIAQLVRMVLDAGLVRQPDAS